MVFFVLSGFLVGGKVIERISAGTFNATNYTIDRAVRIMLPLISALLLYAPIAYFCDIKVSASAWFGSLLSLQGVLTPGAFETLWSLSYEVWFYILMGALAVVLTKRHNRKIATILLILTALVFTKLSASYLFIWIAGALAYVMDNRAGRLSTAIAFVLSVTGILAMQLTSETTTTQAHVSAIPIAVVEILFGVIFAIFIARVIQFVPKNAIARSINKIGTRLATFSYTLYLTHIPVRDLLTHLGAPKSESLSVNSVGLYILWLGVAMTVAWLIYLMFERNTGVVKKWIKRMISAGSPII